MQNKMNSVFYAQSNEHGRSMIEVLGVLAIIGILSVTGIKGFSMMMNKIQANAIAEVISNASVYAQTHNTKVENFADFAEDEDEEVPPKCLKTITATTEGKVTVTFQDTDDCAAVMKMMESAFGQCRWVSDETSRRGSFNPASSWDGTKCD